MGVDDNFLNVKLVTMYRIVIESEMKSAKTNASLYNGQLTDANTMCHRVGITLCGVDKNDLYS